MLVCGCRKSETDRVTQRQWLSDLTLQTVLKSRCRFAVVVSVVDTSVPVSGLLVCVVVCDIGILAGFA